MLLNAYASRLCPCGRSRWTSSVKGFTPLGTCNRQGSGNADVNAMPCRHRSGAAQPLGVAAGIRHRRALFLPRLGLIRSKRARIPPFAYFRPPKRGRSAQEVLHWLVFFPALFVPSSLAPSPRGAGVSAVVPPPRDGTRIVVDY